MRRIGEMNMKRSIMTGFGPSAKTRVKGEYTKLTLQIARP